MPTHDTDNDEAAFITLRMATMAATPGFCGGGEARRRLAEFYRRAGSLGRVHHVIRDGRHALAQVMFFRDPDAWFGGPVVLGWIDRAGAADPKALFDVIDAHRANWGDEALLEIAVLDAPTLAGLVDRGFGIDSVIQVGDPRVAARALAETPTARGAEADIAAEAIDVVPMASGHIADVIALHARVFASEPAWCWFGAFPQHLARMSESLHDERAGQFVVLQNGRVVGHLGAELQDTPYWGPVGGLELVLEPSLRGRGLARSLYRVALASLVTREARVMKGGTSQPGVLALGRTMLRPWHAFNVRARTPFSVAHFMQFAPAAVRAAHGQVWPPA